MTDLSKIIKFATEINEKSTGGFPPVDEWDQNIVVILEWR